MALLAVAMVATACAADEEPAAAPTTTTSGVPDTTAAPAPSGTDVTVASSDLGEILVDGDGNTLYLFMPDAQGESTCYDQCEAAWPPLTGEVSAGDGVDEALLGSAPRTDGSTQVTYNGWPLYYFAADGAPGDTNGQGVNDVWFVVDGAGEAVG
jgi:predicted lipoprotein with Yx(FWY)xxD motif